MSAPRRVASLALARWLDAFDRAGTWRVAGFQLFFTFLVGRVVVSRSASVGTGAGGLTPTGVDLVGLAAGYGAGPEALVAAERLASIPGSVLAVLLAGAVATPFSAWYLSHGPLARDLSDRRLRVPVLHAGRDVVAGAHLLGAVATAATILLGANAVAAVDAAVRSVGPSAAAILGATAGLSLYSAVFVGLAALVAVSVRGGRAALALAVLGLGALAALAAVPGLGLLSPFAHLDGLLSLRFGALLALAALGGVLWAATVLGFRKADL